MSWRNELILHARKEARTALAIAWYRWILGVLFLLVAFGEFPEHRAVIAMGTLFISQCFYLAAAAVSAQAAVDNVIGDAADRKTRHTVIVAHSWAAAGLTPGGEDFWEQVDNTVDKEVGREPDSTPWRATGLITGNVAWRAFQDIIGIGIVYALTSG